MSAKRRNLTSPPRTAAPKISGNRSLIFSTVVIAAFALIACWSGVRWAQSQILTYEAEEAASSWAIFLRSDLADLDRILEGGTISEDDKRIIEAASKAGNIFRYKFFDSNGVIVHASRSSDIGRTNTKPYFAKLVRNGKMFAKIERDEKFAAQRQIVGEAYVPIMSQGRFQGAIEV